LHQIGYNSYRAAKKPFLNENQRQKWLEWCLERQNWTVQQWRNVIWSDESKFTLFRNDVPPGFGVNWALVLILKT
jgi:hypothetical protein